MNTRSLRTAVALWALLALLMPLASAGGAASPAAGNRCACGMQCGEGCCCTLHHHGGQRDAGGHLEARGRGAGTTAGHGTAGPRWASAGAVIAERCGGCQGVASSASWRRSTSSVATGTAPTVEPPSALHPPMGGAGARSPALGSTITPRGPPAPFARP